MYFWHVCMTVNINLGLIWKESAGLELKDELFMLVEWQETEIMRDNCWRRSYGFRLSESQKCGERKGKFRVYRTGLGSACMRCLRIVLLIEDNVTWTGDRTGLTAVWNETTSAWQSDHVHCSGMGFITLLLCSFWQYQVLTWRLILKKTSLCSEAPFSVSN